MVILEQETESKLLTAKQEALIYQLLQSKVFSKKEFEAFYRKIKKQIVTSYDASVCLNYLLASIRFRKMFTSRHARSHAKCVLCNSREDLVRYAELPDLRQVFYCKPCAETLDACTAVPIRVEEIVISDEALHGQEREQQLQQLENKDE